jgi:transcriptional regulator with XRE-family HTH domain
MELCRRAGVRRQTYSALQHTTRRPQRHLITALASALSMDMDEALGLAGLNPTDSDMVRRAITAAHDLADHEKRALLILLDGYDAAACSDQDTAAPQPVPAARSTRQDARHLSPVVRIA